MQETLEEKMVGDLVLAWKEFNDKLTEEQRKKCLLLINTQPKDPNGTDLLVVIMKKHPIPTSSFQMEN